MYARMQRVALVDGRRTAEFPVEVGVSQGSVLSPFLYSVFIDGLIRKLKTDPNLGVRIAAEQLVALLYADDIVLLAPDPVVLQRMLDVTSQYAHQWRFHFNGRKSQIVIQGTEHQITEAHGLKWKLDGHQLNVVPEYKYLGMESGLQPHRGPHRSFCSRLIHTTTHRAHDILLSGCEMNELDARCSSRLWGSLCRPILEYGSEVWKPNQTQSKEMEQVQGWFARRVLGCSQNTPAVFATSELGLRSLAIRREQYHLRYWRRLCLALPERLLHCVFRQRVRDVKVTPHLSKHSLCSMMHETLMKYDLEDQWEQVATDQVFETDEWETKVTKLVQTEEATARQILLAARTSLDTYASALIPELGQMAPYLLHSRNREGAWIQCRLRADCLPLMRTLSRQCRPLRSDIHATCTLCPPPTGAEEESVETVTHFLSECQSPRMISLRQELCNRLEQTIKQWQQSRCEEWANEWKGLPLLACANNSVFEMRSRAAETKNGVATIRAIVASMRISCSADDVKTAAAAPIVVVATNSNNNNSSSPVDTNTINWPHRDWCELRRTDRVTGRSWDPSLLQALQSHTQNFLLLSWRTRADQLGGVPTLLSAGRGITLIPYQRMKSIGVKPISRRPTTRPRGHQ